MRFLFFAGLLLILSFSTLHAQNKKFTGTWEGKLNLGVELRVVFHIKDNGKGGLVAVSDSPDQSVFGIKCDTTIQSGDSVTIEIHDLGASFSGKLENDSTITGTLTQGAGFSLNLKKVEKVSVRVRPQTPQPPFPYKSEDVEYDNRDKTLHYGATITIPEGTGPFPAAVMITGSGPQNRDEEILNHKPFAVIADYLTKKGFVILRVDDRGVEKTNGKFGEATSEDFAKDVNTSLDYLLSRPEVDKKKTGLIGHSEGGMIAPMVATERNDINFIVLLAGPGVKIIDLMAEQNVAFLEKSGISETATASFRPFYKKIVTQIITAQDTAAAKKAVWSQLDTWVTKTKKPIVEELGFKTSKDKEDYVNSMVSQTYTPWFKYFMAFDPRPYLEKLNCSVLAINGDKDIQVISKQNLPGIEAALKKSKAKNYEIKEIPGLNHLFQTCKKCTAQEYGELEETFSPVALQLIADWLEKNVK
jgi:alpha/beta superfamily hydrolase